MHLGRLRTKGIRALAGPRRAGPHHPAGPRDGDGSPHDRGESPGVSRGDRGAHVACSSKERWAMDERKTMRVVYVGWVGFGNLGDDVCRDLFTAHLRRALAAKGRDLEVRWATYQGVSEQYLLEYRPHLVVLGGGSLFTLQYLQPIILAQKHGIPTVVWGTGFDKLSARQYPSLAQMHKQLLQKFRQL